MAANNGGESSNSNGAIPFYGGNQMMYGMNANEGPMPGAYGMDSGGKRSDLEERYPNEYFIRLRGLPFSSTQEDVKQFMTDIDLATVVFPQNAAGRPTGEAYCRLNKLEDKNKALKLDRKEIKGRYIEVFTCTQYEVNGAMLEEERLNSAGNCVVRLRGLPWQAKVEDIKQFFHGLDISEDGVVMVLEHPNPFQSSGRASTAARPTGEAFVLFSHSHSVEKAMGRNRELIGSRYVEVFRSTIEEFSRAKQEMTGKKEIKSLFDLSPAPPPRFGMGKRPYGDDDYYDFNSYGGPLPWMYGGGPPMPPPWMHDGGGMGYDGGPPLAGGGPPRGGPMGPQPWGPPPPNWQPRSVYMRGIPFNTTAAEISKFFETDAITDIQLQYNDQGRPTGYAYVQFETHQDAVNGMQKDRCYLGQRYVELEMGEPEAPLKADVPPPQAAGPPEAPSETPWVAKRPRNDTRWSQDAPATKQPSSSTPAGDHNSGGANATPPPAKPTYAGAGPPSAVPAPQTASTAYPQQPAAPTTGQTTPYGEHYEAWQKYWQATTYYNQMQQQQAAAAATTPQPPTTATAVPPSNPWPQPVQPVPFPSGYAPTAPQPWGPNF